MKKTMAIAVPAMMACLPAPWAKAAEPALAPVPVIGLRETSSTQNNIEQAAEAVKTIPGGAALVDMAKVREGRVSTWTDTLGLTPGVYIQDRFGSEEARISIRGSAISRTYHSFGLTVMQDGIPINYADGFFDMQTIDPSAARHVEVLRGANAASYASSTLGGAINFVSPMGYDSPALLGRAEAGSFGYGRLQAATGAVIRPATAEGNIWDYHLSASAMTQDGYREHSAQDNQKAIANAGVRISKDLESRFFFAAVRSRSQLPGYVTRAQLLSDLSVAQSRWPEDFQRRDLDSLRVANKTVLTQGDYRLELAAYALQQQLWHPIAYGFIEQDTNTVGATLKLSTEARVRGLPNNLSIAYLPDSGSTRGSSRAVAAGFTQGAVTSDYNQKSDNHRFLFEDRLRINERTLLIGSLQYQLARRHVSDSKLTSNNYDLDFTQWIPRLGIVQDITPNAQWFANLSRNFEPPIFGVATRMQASRAQTGNTVEIGTRGEHVWREGHDQIAWDVSLYRSWLSNEFQTVCASGVAVCTNAFAQTVTVNVPRSVHQGLELGASGLLSRRWESRMAMLISDFHFDENAQYGNNRLPGFPPVLLRGELLYRWGESQNGRGLPSSYAGPTFEWVPTRAPMDNTNSISNDRYALLGLKAGGALDATWSWFLDARNLTDKKYAATTNIAASFEGNAGAAYYPGMPRSAYVGIEGKW